MTMTTGSLRLNNVANLLEDVMKKKIQGDYIETKAPQNNPKGTFDVYGRYFAVWTQQADGAWKIARLMLSDKKQPARR